MKIIPNKFNRGRLDNLPESVKGNSIPDRENKILCSYIYSNHFFNYNQLDENLIGRFEKVDWFITKVGVIKKSDTVYYLRSNSFVGKARGNGIMTLKGLNTYWFLFSFDDTTQQVMFKVRIFFETKYMNKAQEVLDLLENGFNHFVRKQNGQENLIKIINIKK